MEKIIVLVVDSSALLIERWQLILSENENIKAIYGAVSYKDASKIFKEINPDLVLLDGCLPGTMSVDLLNEMQAAVEKIPIILLVNSDDANLKAKCHSTGNCLVFDKYYDFEKIPDQINDLFNRIPAKENIEIPTGFYEFDPRTA